MQASHLRAYLETGRGLYNALLCEALKRLRRMRRDPAWQAARLIPRTRPQERGAAFSRLRQKHSFSEFALHDFAKGARCSWIADHIDSTMAQTLATRAYQAVNRVCLGKAKCIRYKSRGRGLDSVEGKRNDVGLRFVLDPGTGDGGFPLWHQEVIPAIINWRDSHRLPQRGASRSSSLHRPGTLGGCGAAPARSDGVVAPTCE